MFIGPTFFDIFVCGPLQSFVVVVCTNINPAKGTTLGTVLLSKKVERTNMLQYKLKKKKNGIIYVCNIIFMIHYQELTRKSISEARGSNVELNISLFTVPYFSV